MRFNEADRVHMLTKRSNAQNKHAARKLELNGGNMIAYSVFILIAWFGSLIIPFMWLDLSSYEQPIERDPRDIKDGTDVFFLRG
jgi:hypothetical protein